MKRALLLITLMVAILWGASAQAATMYYTFTGDVSSVRDWAGLANQAGITRGDTLNYTVAINTDSLGEASNRWDTWTMGSNTYWAESYSGNMQGDTLGSGKTMNNYVQVGGWEQGASQRNVYAGNNYSNIYFHDTYGFQTGFDDWTVGSTIFSSLTETAYSGSISSTVTLNNITLSRVSSQAPTPVPAAIWFMGMGAAGLGLVTRKKKR